ncbi:MAG: DUF192 domain-containing protein [Halorhodospira sp.]
MVVLSQPQCPLRDQPRRGRSFPIAALALILLVAPSTTALESMPRGLLLIDGEPVAARIADTPEARARGFQHADEAQLRSERIYFRWETPQRPSFHMHNVAAALAIVWIDARDRVIGIDRMDPEQAGYQPPWPAQAALELAPSAVDKLGIAPGSTIRRMPSE